MQSVRITVTDLVDLVTRSSGGHCDMQMRDTLLRQETFISAMVIRSSAGVGHNRLPGPRNKTDRMLVSLFTTRSNRRGHE